MTTNQDLHEQVAAYALDALDEDERRAYEAHLSGCARCRADLAGLTETAGALGLAAGAAEPPDPLAVLGDPRGVLARDERRGAGSRRG